MTNEIKEEKITRKKKHNPITQLNPKMFEFMNF